jgi:hypothetical protein
MGALIRLRRIAALFALSREASWSVTSRFNARFREKGGGAFVALRLTEYIFGATALAKPSRNVPESGGLDNT